jgi:cation diffusion facilitator CzcD-associated flavoprotein CzcO
MNLHHLDDPGTGSEIATNFSDATFVDAVVIGAGLGGLYAIKRLRADGLSVRGFEAAAGVGGVWLHNAYPGARVDIEAYYYSYLDPEFYKTWKWVERYPSQPEILAYLKEYARFYDLEKHFKFSTRAEKIHWNETNQRWLVEAKGSKPVLATHVVLASGQLSQSRPIPFPGSESFRGQWLETSHWPSEPVDLKGKRVAVIGTGSSGVQVASAVAKVAGSLHVFQRTPNYVVPSQNGPIDQELYAKFADNVEVLKESVMNTGAAYIAPSSDRPARDLTDEQINDRLQEQWNFGGLALTFAFPDQRTDPAVNEKVSTFVRNKIREQINDPALADRLEPAHYPIGTRRLCVCNDYYATYNRPNVELVDARDESIVSITEDGVKTSHRELEFDVIISALGFDAFTGALDSLDIKNSKNEHPADYWKEGPNAYLGLMQHGFPNLHILTGPGSPSVLVNFNVHNVFHVDFVADLIGHMKKNQLQVVEASKQAQESWREHSQEIASNLLRKKVDNYMVHVNEDGSRFFVPYSGGWKNYVGILKEVQSSGFEGFEFDAHTLETNFVDEYSEESSVNVPVSMQ